MSKEAWIKRVYELLCKSKGTPANETEEKNLRCMSETMAQHYYDEGMTPEEAHEEEIFAFG